MQLGLLLGFCLVALFLWFKSLFRVPESHVAVLTSFGRAVHVPGSPRTLRLFRAGLNFKAPWQHVHLVRMMEQNLDLSGDHRGLSAMAQDGTILRFDSVLRFVPKQEELYEYLFGLRAPLEHITGLFSCLLRSEIANFKNTLPTTEPHPTVLGSYALLRRERHTLHARIKSFVQERIGAHYGVQFHAVDLTDILPPDELAEALNAVINAQTEAGALLAQAEAECQQRILAADQGVAIAKSHAQAAADEALQIAAHLQALDRASTLDPYVARRRAEVYGTARSIFVREKEAT